MLFQLGVITIASPGPFNATDTAEEFGSDFAVKPVVGAQQPREFMGQADDHMTISGTLFPFFYGRAGQTSGLDEIEMLRAITGTGDPQPLVRGDGTSLGSWLVEKVSVKGSRLSADGIGRVVAYDIQLVRSATDATPAALAGMLETLFS